MKKIIQRLIVILYIVISYLLLDEKLALYPYTLLGTSLLFINPLYSLIFVIPIIAFNIYGKAYLLGLIPSLFLISYIVHKKKLLIILTLIIYTSLFFYIRRFYSVSIWYNVTFYLSALTLSIIILYLSNITKSTKAIIDEHLIYLIHLLIIFAILLINKPKYYSYHLLLLVFFITKYSSYYNLILIIFVYLFNKPYTLEFSLYLILMNYKSPILSLSSLLIYYGLNKPQLNIYDVIFVLIFLAINIIHQKKSIKKSKNESNNILANDFKDYLNSLDILFTNKQKNIEALHKLKKEIEDTYCKSCLFKKDCMQNIGIHYSFLRGVILYNSDNYINCPNYSNFPKIDKENDISYYSHESLKNLFYSYQNDTKFLDNIYTNYNKLFYLLNKDKIKYQNFIPSYYTLSFKIEIFDDSNIILGYLKKMINYVFKKPLIYKLENKKSSFFLTVRERPSLKITYATAILNKHNNSISGDNYLIKKSYDSRTIFALSDGMGSGIDAYNSSKEILSILSNMLNYHFSTKTMLNFLSYIYEIKGNYESYATLDLLEINEVTKAASLFKLGSASTFLFSDIDKIYENSSLPLDSTDLIDSFTINLKANDIILLLTDGFTDYLNYHDIKEIIYNNKFASASIIADMLCNKIKQQNKILNDDCSVIVIKVN